MKEQVCNMLELKKRTGNVAMSDLKIIIMQNTH